MTNLSDFLPKDLINIIDDYSKDRSNYDITICQFNNQLHNSFTSIFNRYIHPSRIMIQYDYPMDWDQIYEMIDTDKLFYKFFKTRMLKKSLY